MSQLDMFGPPTKRAVERPTPEEVRPELAAVLERLAVSDVIPFSAKDLRFWRVVFPQMSRWLPDDERERMCEAFHSELARLEEKSAT